MDSRFQITGLQLTLLQILTLSRRRFLKRRSLPHVCSLGGLLVLLGTLCLRLSDEIPAQELVIGRVVGNTLVLLDVCRSNLGYSGVEYCIANYLAGGWSVL